MIENELTSISENVINLKYSLIDFNLTGNNLTSIPTEALCELNSINYYVGVILADNLLCLEYYDDCYEVGTSYNWSNQNEFNQCCVGPDGQDNWMQCGGCETENISYEINECATFCLGITDESPYSDPNQFCSLIVDNDCEKFIVSSFGVS